MIHFTIYIAPEVRKRACTLFNDKSTRLRSRSRRAILQYILSHSEISNAKIHPEAKTEPFNLYCTAKEKSLLKTFKDPAGVFTAATNALYESRRKTTEKRP